MRTTAMAPAAIPGYAGSRVSPKPSYGNPVPCAKTRLLSNNRVLAERKKEGKKEERKKERRKEERKKKERQGV